MTGVGVPYNTSLYLILTSGKIHLTWQQPYFHFKFHLHIWTTIRTLSVVTSQNAKIKGWKRKQDTTKFTLHQIGHFQMWHSTLVASLTNFSDIRIFSTCTDRYWGPTLFSPPQTMWGGIRTRKSCRWTFQRKQLLPEEDDDDNDDDGDNLWRALILIVTFVRVIWMMVMMVTTCGVQWQPHSTCSSRTSSRRRSRGSLPVK